jgi:CheY-like chemotaxis protein
MSNSFVPESRLRVLAVDSDEDSRYLLYEILIRCNIEPFMFGMASDALAWLENETPNLLISELRLIDEDGCTFIKKVKALESIRQTRIPSIALTASVLLPDQARARSAGFDVHMAKPFIIDDLISHINMLTLSRVSLVGDDLISE